MALLGLPGASAQVVLEVADTAAGNTGQAPADLWYDVPFHLAQNGTWSVKLLALPDNPVYSGTANGSVDDPASPTGWYVELFLRSADSGTAVDRQGSPVDPLGLFVDGRRSNLVDLPGGTTYRLSVHLRVPEDAAGASGRVPLALMWGAAATSGNGGGLESSKAFTIHLDPTGAPDTSTDGPTPSIEPTGTPDPNPESEPDDGENHTDTGAGDGTQADLQPAVPFQPLSEIGAAFWVQVAVAVLGLAVLVFMLWWGTRPLRQIRDRLDALVEIEARRLAWETEMRPHMVPDPSWASGPVDTTSGELSGPAEDE